MYLHFHFSDVWPCSELQFGKELNNVLQLVRKWKPICRVFKILQTLSQYYSGKKIETI